MSDRYGSYRHDRFVFGPESTVVPLVVRFVSSLFFPFGPAVFSVYPL